MLRKLRAKLTRLARTAEDFRSMASPDWAPRVGAYINAAHWMSHSLQEAAGPLLLLDLEGSTLQAALNGHPLWHRVATQIRRQNWRELFCINLLHQLQLLGTRCSSP